MPHVTKVRNVTLTHFVTGQEVRGKDSLNLRGHFIFSSVLPMDSHIMKSYPGIERDKGWESLLARIFLILPGAQAKQPRISDLLTES